MSLGQPIGFYKLPFCLSDTIGTPEVQLRNSGIEEMKSLLQKKRKKRQRTWSKLVSARKRSILLRTVVK